MFMLSESLFLLKKIMLFMFYVSIVTMLFVNKIKMVDIAVKNY